MSALNWPVVPCCMPGNQCVCGPDERPLRAIMDGYCTVPMTVEQRHWCLMQINSVEGYKAEEHYKATDAELARVVMDAWTDYARDKGLL